MEVEITHRPGAAAARIALLPGESCTTEGGAMISMSSDLKIETTTHKRGKGGVLKAMKRLLAGESLFLNHYTAGPSGGEVWVAPPLVGDMMAIDLAEGQTLVVQSGSYVASSHSVEMDMGWQGFKTFLSGESLFWIQLKGPGTVVLNSYGAIYPITIEEEHIVDTGHIVAFDPTLTFSISKAGKSWIHSFLGGEGLVCRFKGRGRVWAQSHNAAAFGRTLGPLLRPRR